MKDIRAQNFMWSLGYAGSFAVSSVGLSGGLALFWLPQYTVSLKGFNSHFIDVAISSDNEEPWRATFVYGEPRRDQRHEFRNSLCRLRSEWRGPWICCGDFNEALSHDEHVGARDRSESQMTLFRDCLDDCGLFDLGFSGLKYTWNNRKREEDHVKVRLDRAVANGDFTTRFDKYNVENIITTASDHLAILINLSTSRWDERPPVQHGFRFEAAWLRAPDYREVLEKAWTDRAGGDLSLQSTWATLNQVAVSLQSWRRETFGAVRHKIRKIECKLHYLRVSASGEGIDEIRNLEKELCELFEREEIMARQRSRVEWLREGDRNTSFFHARATARKRANKIQNVKMAHGVRM
jgi:hypothetical protein